MARRFSASAAGQMMTCHASANLAAAIPGWEPPAESSGGAAKAGTGVHELVEALMKMEYVTPSKTTKFSAKDMLAFAAMLQYIGELWSRRRWNVLNEVEMSSTWLANPTTTKADIVFHTQDEIHVVDSKWGKIPVEVVDNEQLLYYAATYGALAPKAKGVTVHIVQPRADNMTEWFISADRLKEFMDEALATEAAIAQGDLSFGPSKHCTFCPANPQSRSPKGRPLCPAQMSMLYPSIFDEDAILDL